MIELNGIPLSHSYDPRLPCPPLPYLNVPLSVLCDQMPKCLFQFNLIPAPGTMTEHKERMGSVQYPKSNPLTPTNFIPMLSPMSHSLGLSTSKTPAASRRAISASIWCSRDTFVAATKKVSLLAWWFANYIRLLERKQESVHIPSVEGILAK